MAIWQLTQDFIPNDILHTKEIRSPLLTVVDINNNNEYSLPSVKPSVPSLLEVLPDGTSQFLDAAGLVGNPDALINIEPLVPVLVGQIPIFDGTNNFNVKSQSILSVDTITNTVKISDATSSEFTTITTNGATYINHNGSSGLVLDAGTGDMTLSSTKLFGVVNINTYNGLSFNNVGLIKNEGSDLRMYNGDGNTSIESKQNNVFLRVGDNLKYENGLTSALYNIVPTAQPSNNSIVEYQADGTCAFIPTPSGALINTDYLNDAPLGSTFIFDGTNGTNGSPTNLINVNTSTNTINLSATNGTFVDKLLQIKNDPFYFNISINDFNGNVDFQNSIGMINTNTLGQININSQQEAIYLRTQNGVGIIDNPTGKLSTIKQDNNNLNITNSNIGANLTLQCPIVNVLSDGALKIVSETNQALNYNLPNPNTPPQQNQIITFNSDGTSQFVNQATPLTSSIFNYRASTPVYGIPADGYIEWAEPTQITPLLTQIRVSHINQDGQDIDTLLELLQVNDTLIIQDKNNSDNYQKWIIQNLPIVVPNSYIEFSVSLNAGGYIFSNNHNIVLITSTGSSILALQNQVQQNTFDIGVLQGDVSTLQGQVSTNTSNIASNTSAITALQINQYLYRVVPITGILQTPTQVFTNNFILSANHIYKFEYYFTYSITATTAGNFLILALDVPDAPTKYNASFSIITNVGANTPFIAETPFDNTIIQAPIVNTANTIYSGTITGIIQPSINGLMVLRAYKGAGGTSTLTFNSGYGLMTKIGP